jgi:hypothetical protein
MSLEDILLKSEADIEIVETGGLELLHCSSPSRTIPLFSLLLCLMDGVLVFQEAKCDCYSFL